MDDLLTKINIRIRRFKPVMRKGAFYTSWREHSTLQITYKSRGCRYSAGGSCLMCDYGAGVNLSLAEAETVLPEVLAGQAEPIDELLLNTYGSFLDPYEIPDANRRRILEQVSKADIPYVTLETHYKTITQDRIEEIQSYLGDRMIGYEMGLESASPYVLESCLNKELNIKKMEECFRLIDSYHHISLVNVLYGSPFLSSLEQQEDALASVLWAHEHGADVIILFPVNIKPFTALEHLYKGGFYQPVSHWGFIQLLSIIPDTVMGKINIAWYGNREVEYPGYNFKPILPQSCACCHKEIMNFYDKFTETREIACRRTLITNILSMPLICDCRSNAMKQLQNPHYSKKLGEEAREYLRKSILKDGKYAIPWKEY